MSIIKKAKVSADKRSIDAYGRSIELAIAGYLLDNGTFPTSIDQLTMGYSGSEVVCSTTQLNSDSSVYLTRCTVGGRSVDYIYGKEETTPAPTYTAYSIVDHISYNNVTYYVIEDSDENNDTVKLLKENILTKAEIDSLNLSDISVGNYGTVQYGSSTDYSTSTVKKVVDAWKNTAVASGDTAIARLISLSDLTDNLGYEYAVVGTTQYYKPSVNTPFWVCDSHHDDYWTMSQKVDSAFMWYVFGNGELQRYDSMSSSMVRPVLELSKTADISIVN